MPVGSAPARAERHQQADRQLPQALHQPALALRRQARHEDLQVVRDQAIESQPVTRSHAEHLVEKDVHQKRADHGADRKLGIDLSDRACRDAVGDRARRSTGNARSITSAR